MALSPTLAFSANWIFIASDWKTAENAMKHNVSQETKRNV